MENIATEGACVSCGEPGAAARCEHCGVATAPGGYVVERVVAQTTHARLYQARAPDGSKVAVKELLFALVPDAQAVESFERESALLKTLDHPQIPNFIDSFREGQGTQMRLYLVQEFVDGMSLADRIDRHRFDESQATQIARDVLRILGYLHALSPRVIHRDVKPANLIQKPDATLVLVDFDAARDLDRDVTHRATMVGTFGYMPPEQLGGTVDVTADLYALGATLIHLLTRRPPTDLFVAGEGFTLRDHVHASDGFIAWLEKMCALNRADRYQSAQAALRGLDVASYPAPVVQKGNGKLVLIAGIVALATTGALVAVGVGVWRSLPSFSVKRTTGTVWRNGVQVQLPVVVAPPPLPEVEPTPAVEVEPPPMPEPVPERIVKRVETPPPAPPPFPATRAERVQRVGSSFDKPALAPGVFNLDHILAFGDASTAALTFSKLTIERPESNAMVRISLRGNVQVPPGGETAQIQWATSGDGVQRATGAIRSIRAGTNRDFSINVPVGLYSTAFHLELSAGRQKKSVKVDLVKHSVVGR